MTTKNHQKIRYLSCILVGGLNLKHMSSSVVHLIPNISNVITGWWLSHPSEKYEFLSWDDDIPNVSH